MKNKKFYFAKGGNKFGPKTLEELKTQELCCDTLIWHDGMENWTEIKDIPELYNILKINKLPPPLPKNEGKVTKTEVSGELNVLLEKKSNKIFEKLSPSHKVLRIFLIWFGIHLFALITSYSEIDFFNKGTPLTNKFWPFVKVFQYHDRPYMLLDKKGYWDYNGIFYSYDWSEFLVFVGGVFLIFAITQMKTVND